MGRRANSQLLRGFALAFLISACAPAVGSPHPTTAAPPSQVAFFILISNIDGPVVDIEVNGTIVLRSTCDPLAQSPVPEITTANRPPLPWVVRVLGADGSVLGTWTERGDIGPRTIFVRADGVREDAYGANPGPAPAPTCSP